MLWAVIGRIGLGFVMPSLNLGSMHGLPDIFISQGSSTINFLRQLGGAVGIGLVGNVLEWRLRTHPAAPVTAYHETFAPDRRDHRLRRRLRRPDGPDGRPQDAAPTPRMNLGIGELPARCDVLVVGAGPAGSAAAQWLARAGRDVVLVDQQAFPRDKVCGDGLIADALRALDRLGVKERGAGRGAALGDARLHRPARRPDRRARLAGGAAAEAPRRDRLPRRGRGRRADVRAAALRRAARARAAASSAPSSSTTARAVGCAPHWLVLATGAQPQAMLAAGLCERRAPSGIALRGYVRNPAMTPRIASLEVVWHKRLAPGYGWIFPCGDDVFNIGVGVAQDGAGGAKPGRAAPHLNLREAFAAFQSLYAPARELVAGRRMAGPARRGR